ncbi:MAG: hypothetical protein IGS50_17990 [Synechococcales cyanobacterium C42_A2020_086]|jgi:hypothetical protein|nr:hypothetical protein [Synechococcales cyanobacterium M58_A2018_015]MBF2075635.1 hypothetical protein [Synechococcales cyanobacterium C42_A2020_086]
MDFRYLLRKDRSPHSASHLDKAREVWRDRWQETYQAMQDRISRERDRPRQF